jgi:hypothetical protein
VDSIRRTALVAGVLFLITYLWASPRNVEDFS